MRPTHVAGPAAALICVALAASWGCGASMTARPEPVAPASASAHPPAGTTGDGSTEESSSGERDAESVEAQTAHPDAAEANCGLGPQLSAEEHMARYGCPPCPCACSNGVLVCAPCAVCMPQAVSDVPLDQ